MSFTALERASAIALFAITIATIAVMWEPYFWATAIAEVGVFCLAAVWLTVSAINPSGVQFHAILIPLGCAVLWPLLQLGAGTTIYRFATSTAVLYWACNAATVLVGLQIFRNPENKRRYLRALTVTAFLLAIIGPLQLFTAEGKIYWLFEAKYSDIAIGPFVYSNQFAAFMELLLPISLVGSLSDRGGWKTFHALASVVIYASVIASASRMGFALATLEIIVVPFLAIRRIGISPRQLFLPGLVFLGMLVVLVLAAGPERTIGKLSQKDPYSGRREFVESSLRMIPDKPLMGVGMGNWSAAYPAYAIFDNGLFANQAHNDWVQWAVEGGIPFLLLMVSVAVWAFRGAVRTAWGAGPAVVFLHCFVDYPIQRMGVAIVFFSLLAAIAYPDGDQSPPSRSGKRRRLGTHAE